MDGTDASQLQQVAGPAQEVPTSDLGRSSYLVESYSTTPGSSLAAIAGRMRQATQRAGAARRVRYRGSIAVPGDEMTFHLFAAAEPGPVLEVCRAVGISCDRIVVVVPGGWMTDLSRTRRSGGRRCRI